jgi:membrane-associated phospholipid phosphatase
VTRVESGESEDPIESRFGTAVRALGVPLQAADVVGVGALLLVATLAAAVRAHVAEAGAVLARSLVCAAIYLAAITLHGRLGNRHLRFLVRTGAVQLLCAQLYILVFPLQLILVPRWQDPAVVALEQALFGAQPVVWLQRFIAPGLTEWLMFAYVVYLLIYPVLAAFVFYRHGERALEHYLFTLIVTNVACDFGFILFPVASPNYYQPVRELLTVPLRGGFFTACGEYIRTHIHRIGGSLPSAHTAVATVMWLTAWRYYRPAFWVLAPIILSLYVSTFFLRYHYVSDAVAGIAVGLLAVAAAPALARAWQRATTPLGAVPVWKF